MSSEEIVISVRNLSKSYRLFDHPGDRIKQFLSFGLKRYYRGFTALKDVSFEIRKGETVGIIGRNGSGKSTLLQLICGILRSTSGSVQVNGRISALLELGSGFNPEFTGRENVYFQGVLMGFSKAQMDARIDEIAAFADIGEFIDQPVRMYSSGMFMRLAFATAIYVDPDILVVDEALAVGDELFQRKCYAQLRQLADEGCTVLFVSHSGTVVGSLCDRVFLMEQGNLLKEGLPTQMLAAYQELLYAPQSQGQEPGPGTGTRRDADNSDDNEISKDFPPSRIVYATNGARISNVRLLRQDGSVVDVLACNKIYYFQYEVEFDVTATQVRGAAMIKTIQGFELGGFATHPKGGEMEKVLVGERLTFRIPFACHLLPGTYFLNCSVLSGDFPLHRIVDVCAFQVVGEHRKRVHGIVDFSAELSLPPAQSSSPSSTTSIP